MTYRIKLNNLYVSAEWNRAVSRFDITVSTSSEGCNEFSEKEYAQSFCNQFVSGGPQYKGTKDGGNFYVEEIQEGD